jgi:hypothetical protein
MAVDELDRQAEALQALLERLERGETLPDVRADAGELAGLLSVAAAARGVLPVRAPATFKARSQMELQSRQLGRRGRAGGRPAVRWLPRLSGSLLALALVAATAVVASADSLPGQPLYGVKRAVEETRLAITPAGRARAALRVAIADERAGELRRLLDERRQMDPAWIQEALSAQARAVDEASHSGDPGLEAQAARRARETARLAEQALGREPVQRGGAAPPAMVPSTDVEAEQPDVRRTRTPDPDEPMPTATPRATEVAEASPTAERPMTLDREGAPPPAARPPHGPGEAPPAAGPPGDRRERPRPTDPPPDAGEAQQPSPEPTLKKAHEREATQQAPTAEPPRRPTRARPGESGNPVFPAPATETPRSRPRRAEPTASAESPPTVTP